MHLLFVQAYCPGYDYPRSRMVSNCPFDRTTIVAAPRALRNASVPPRMPKCPTAPASGNAAKPPKIICPLSNATTERHCTSESGRVFWILTIVHTPAPEPTFVSLSSNNSTLLMIRSPSLGLARLPGRTRIFTCTNPSSLGSGGSWLGACAKVAGGSPFCRAIVPIAASASRADGLAIAGFKFFADIFMPFPIAASCYLLLVLRPWLKTPWTGSSQGHATRQSTPKSRRLHLRLLGLVPRRSFRRRPPGRRCRLLCAADRPRPAQRAHAWQLQSCASDGRVLLWPGLPVSRHVPRPRQVRASWRPAPHRPCLVCRESTQRRQLPCPTVPPCSRNRRCRPAPDPPGAITRRLPPPPLLHRTLPVLPRAVLRMRPPTKRRKHGWDRHLPQQLSSPQLQVCLPAP